MAKTKVEDVFVPEVWEQYFIERTAELAMFYESGIVQRAPEFDALASGPGTAIEMPFWNDISGERQIIHDTNPFTVNKITASKDRARIHNDGNSWSTTLLADLLAGDDGMDAIVELVGQYWARVDEEMLVATVNGVLAEFDSITGDPNLLKIASEDYAGTSADTVLNGETFIDGKQKLGDRKDRIVAIAMHSEVEADLLKQQLIEFVPDADGREFMETFQGLRVIKDDDLPKRDGVTSGSVYTTVLFGEGAIARGLASLDDPVEGGFGTDGVERSRVPLNHDAVMINRRRHIMHPRGVRWDGNSVANENGGPTNAELEMAANWTKVYEAKNIRIVGIVHNILSQVGQSGS